MVVIFYVTFTRRPSSIYNACIGLSLEDGWFTVLDKSVEKMFIKSKKNPLFKRNQETHGTFEKRNFKNRHNSSFVFNQVVCLTTERAFFMSKKRTAL